MHADLSDKGDNNHFYSDFMQLKRNNSVLLRNMLASWCLWLMPVIALHAAEQAGMRDIRVVIDLSGSMKQNDPHNHRTKAVQLFSEVLPSDVKAGIWTFASGVNMLIKHGTVDKTWKQRAFESATKIHSYGLHTNIEKALTVATDDWYKPDPKVERHLILLTDGYIDISKDKNKNTASRKRVINKLLPALKAKGIIIHSIALSEHADHALLKKLSHKTQGNYKVINNASDLDRYFFKLFQTTTKPDTIPFKANRFKIDKAINDMTVVLFASNYPTKLITPQKEKWSFKNHPATVKWVKSDNYEIITIRNPIDGDWRVDAPLDPDNKVMVVTNLKLNVNKLPDLLMPGDKPDIKTYLTDEHKIIDKDSFIKLVNIKITAKKKGAITRSVLKTKYTGKGYFTSTLDSDNFENLNILTIIARGPTFTRQYEHEFTVVTNPVKLEAHAVNDNRILVEAVIDNRVIDSDSLKISIDDHGHSKLFDYATGKWSLYLDNKYSGKTITMNVDSHFHNGKVYKKSYKLQLPVLKEKVIEHVKPAVKPAVKHTPVKKVEVATPPAPVDTLNKHDVKTEVVKKDKGTFSWILVFTIILVVNVAIIIAGYYIYRYFKKTGADSMDLDESEVNQLSDNKNESSDSSLDEIEGLEDIDSEISSQDKPESTEKSTESNENEVNENKTQPEEPAIDESDNNDILEDIDGLEDIDDTNTTTDGKPKAEVKSGEL